MRREIVTRKCQRQIKQNWRLNWSGDPKSSHLASLLPKWRQRQPQRDHHIQTTTLSKLRLLSILGMTKRDLARKWMMLGLLKKMTLESLQE